MSSEAGGACGEGAAGGTAHPAQRRRSANTHTHTNTRKNSVTETEAQRWDEAREAREARKAEFRSFLVEHYAKRGEALPEYLRDDAGAGSGAQAAAAPASK